MSSQRRIEASRANGRLSRGPRTIEGKATSSQSAIRHGLLARCVVMDGERQEDFHALIDQFTDRLQPVDGMEFGLIEEMASAFWRLRRVWAIETRMLDNKTNQQTQPDDFDAVTAAFCDASTLPTLALIHRYEARLHLMSHRSLRTFLLLREKSPVPPAAESEAQQNDSAPSDPV